jgi:hypothetical protein
MRTWALGIFAASLAAAPAAARAQPRTDPAAASAPTPLELAVPADWIFIFKLNSRSFPSVATAKPRPCPFGGTAQPYTSFSQQYAYATSVTPALKGGPGLVGTSLDDPLGATFAKIWNGNYNYVVWNDQFYQNPLVPCAKGASRNNDQCGGPWGHSKGILAWNDAGEGLVLQVTTPSWPAAASKANPRPNDGNTLGCIVRPNNLKFSQHFFTLRLNASDVGHVLDALANASVVTDIANPVLVHNGGSPAIQAKVRLLGVKSTSTALLDVVLSTGVRLVSKPSKLNVPTWQFISAVLGGVPLRSATWWASPPSPKIPTTTAATPIPCWSTTLGKPGAVEIATSGHWAGKEIDLKGSSGNHAKIGVSLDPARPYTIFADLNQQGRLSGDCTSSQNGRGGLFFVVTNPVLRSSVAALVQGDTAPQ